MLGHPITSGRWLLKASAKAQLLTLSRQAIIPTGARGTRHASHLSFFMRGISTLALIAVAAGGAVELNKANFDEQVHNSGKGAFVKFQAPW
jgi:hypothetical protein